MTESSPFVYKFADGFLQWFSPRLTGGGMAGDLPVGGWRYCSGETAGNFHWSVRPENVQPLTACWGCTIEFAPVQCSSVLVNGDSMGGCRILTATTPQQEFSSSGVLLLRIKREFVLLELAAGISPGELFWHGIWKNGAISSLRAEVSERFAQSGTVPEISVMISRGNDPHRLLDDWVKRHYPVRKTLPDAYLARHTSR